MWQLVVGSVTIKTLVSDFNEDSLPLGVIIGVNKPFEKPVVVAEWGILFTPMTARWL